MAAVTQLGASSCFRATRSSQRIHGAAGSADGGLRTTSSNVVCFGRALQRHRPQRFLRCVAEDAPANPPATATPTSKAVEAPKKPAFTMTKGQIVRVDKEKYLNSIEYYALGHPKFFKGIDYIYEDRGEILNLRFFEAGEYALITWAGIPTAPAWLPTYMLIKSDKLSYKRV
ncbi:unnamed protein product [Calypogeia fissa]